MNEALFTVKGSVKSRNDKSREFELGHKKMSRVVRCSGSHL
jgi:hypothetical protein